jgi:hypothetical protein
VWSVGSSLWVYPHSLAYFNEVVGGPKKGHAHLSGSNLEWGQDLLYLRRWLDKHPEARPLSLAYYLDHLVDASLAEIDYLPTPLGPHAKLQDGQTVDDLGPKPGWHAVSVTRLCARSGKHAYFQRFRPVASAGYSIHIYHIRRDEANRVRRELGLPELSECGPSERGAHDEEIGQGAQSPLRAKLEPAGMPRQEGVGSPPTTGLLVPAASLDEVRV